MPVPGGGFEQCYNAQAAVAAGSLLVVANDVVQATNDKQQVEPMLGKLAALPERLGRGRNVAGRYWLFQRGERRRLRGGRDRSADRDGSAAALSAAERTLRPAAAAAGEPNAGRGDGASAEDARGKKLYALRKQTPEPVFGIIKSVLGFRHSCSAASTTSAASGTS